MKIKGKLTDVAISIVNGGPMGYAIDIFRDLTVVIEQCDRMSYPDFLKNRNPKTKKAIAAVSGLFIH